MVVMDFNCKDEVPLHWVRANQLGILLCIAASALLQAYAVLLIALIVQLISRFWGIRYNLFVRLLAPLLPESKKTESRELLRFNNLLAILFLAVSLLSFFLNFQIAGYIAALLLTVAVVLALCGFCLGCFIYYQWKQWRRRMSS